MSSYELVAERPDSDEPPFVEESFDTIAEAQARLVQLLTTSELATEKIVRVEPRLHDRYGLMSSSMLDDPPVLWFAHITYEFGDEVNIFVTEHN